MKNKKIILSLIASLITLSIITLFIYVKHRQKPVIDLTYEKFVPEGPSLLVRMDNLEDVWRDFKGTNFYSQLNDFLVWFWKEMPSESMGFSSDIKDIQENIGFELNEKNIIDFLGKKVMAAVWHKNENRNVLVISALDKKSSLIAKIMEIVSRKTGVEGYKNTSINVFKGNRYFGLVDGKLIVSNDIDILKRCIDLMTDGTGNSVLSDSEFDKNIKNIIPGKYVYIKPKKIGGTGYAKIGNELDNILLDIEFKEGVSLKAYASRKTAFAKPEVEKVKSLSFIPADVLFFAAGSIPVKFFVPISAIEKTLVGNESGYAVSRYKGKNAFMIFCNVRDRKLFLEKFKELVKSINTGEDTFRYPLPFFGLMEFKYYFAQKYFVVCSPPEFSDTVKGFKQKKESSLKESAKFRQLKLPSKVNEIFYLDISNIYLSMLRKDYLKFMQPSGGYATFTPAGFESSYRLPMTDLSAREWKEIFAELRKMSSNKILEEKERITRKNLFYIREALDIYNAKTKRYPKKLNSLIEEYLDEIPQELLTRSNKINPEFDGKGGWVYRNNRVSLNVQGKDLKGGDYTDW